MASMSSAQPSDPPANDQNQRHPQTAEAGGNAWRGGPLAGICSLLAAGLLAWLLVQAVHPLFATAEGADEFGFLPLDVQWRLDRNNSMFVLGLLGGLAGLGLALGEGLSRRSWKTALLAGAMCGAAGLAFGGLAGYLGHRVFEFYKSNAEVTDLDKAIRVYGVMFAVLGGGVGLAVAAVLGRSFRAAINGTVGGLLAGVLAGVSYPVTVAALMPGALTTVLIPLEAGERLLWFGLATGLLGLIIPTALARIRMAHGPPSK